jgi:hypothetical protein
VRAGVVLDVAFGVCETESGKLYLDFHIYLLSRVSVAVRTLDPIRCALCVKSSLDPGGIQRTKSNLSPERVHR